MATAMLPHLTRAEKIALLDAAQRLADLAGGERKCLRCESFNDQTQHCATHSDRVPDGHQISGCDYFSSWIPF